MNKIRNVTFLCSGNTCRSVAALGLAQWLKDTKYKSQLSDVTFDSAGLYHYYETPQEGTLRYLDSKGIKLNNFQAKAIDEQLINKQDLILGFEEKWHVRKLKRKFKQIHNLDKKAFLLLDFAGEKENLEILDPFDYDEKEYEKTMKRIEEGVIKAIEKIIEINNYEVTDD